MAKLQVRMNEAAVFGVQQAAARMEKPGTPLVVPMAGEAHEVVAAEGAVLFQDLATVRVFLSAVQGQREHH